MCSFSTLLQQCTSTQEGSCKCNKGYLTYEGYVQYGRKVNFNENNCKYKQKQKLTAFLLSIVIGPTGADWYYLNAGNPVYVIIGVVKCLMSIIGVVAKVQGKKRFNKLLFIDYLAINSVDA